MEILQSLARKTINNATICWRRCLHLLKNKHYSQLPTGIYSWLLITRTLDNSNLQLTQVVFFPFRSFLCNFTLDNSNHVLSPEKVGKNSLLASETSNFEFPIDVFVGVCSSNSLATRWGLHLGLYSSLTSANNLNLPTLVTLFYFSTLLFFY